MKAALYIHNMKRFSFQISGGVDIEIIQDLRIATYPKPEAER
jgi:hypothetical protein